MRQNHFQGTSGIYRAVVVFFALSYLRGRAAGQPMLKLYPDKRLIAFLAHVHEAGALPTRMYFVWARVWGAPLRVSSLMPSV